MPGRTPQRSSAASTRCGGTRFTWTAGTPSEHVKEVLAALDWFIATYGNASDEPLIEQRVVWNEEREKINEKIDQILAVAENI